MSPTPASPRKKQGLQNLHFKYLSIHRSSTSNVSASEQILYNPELLELILMHLPPRDLLTSCSLVSHLWNSLITTSPMLQRLLYFQPLLIKKGRAVGEAQANPVLKEVFFPWFRTFNAIWGHSSQQISRRDFRNLDWNRRDSKREAYRRKEASWRRMLVAQPPVTEMHILRKYWHQGPPNVFIGKASFPDGLRMGQLYDLTHDAASAPSIPSGFKFKLEWKRSGYTFPEDRASDDEERVWLSVEHTVSIRRSSESPLEPAFISLGYEPLDIKWMKENGREFQGSLPIIHGILPRTPNKRSKGWWFYAPDHIQRFLEGLPSASERYDT